MKTLEEIEGMYKINEDFVLEIESGGFTLWKIECGIKKHWVVDASMFKEDNNVRIGKIERKIVTLDCISENFEEWDLE